MVGRLLDQVRPACRLRHLYLRTEMACVSWICRLIYIHGKHHSHFPGSGDVRAFHSHLTLQALMAASTQIQALAARLLVNRYVLEQESGA